MPAQPASPKLVRRTAAGVLLVTLVVYLASLAATTTNSDAYNNAYGAWHLAHTGTPFFDDVDELPYVGGPDYFGENADGHVVLARTPGQIWAAVPFYAVLSDGPDFRHFSTGPGYMAAAFWTSVAMALFFLSLTRSVSIRAALVATAVLAFATPVWSVSAATLYPHCITVLALAGAALALSRDRWGWAGLALGLGILARPHLAVVAAVVGLGLALARRSPRIALLIAAGSGLGLAVLVLWNHHVFGEWSVTAGYAQTADDLVPGARESRLDLSYPEQVAGFLVALDKGFLIWSPVVIVLVPVLLRHLREIPAWMLWLAAGGAAYTLAQCAVNEFTGGSGFNGYRLGLELLICIAPALTVAGTLAGRRARALMCLALTFQAAMVTVATFVELWLLEDDAWTANSTFTALHDRPTTALPLFVLSALVAGIVCRMLWHSGSRTQQAVHEEAVGAR